jgi:hypothetical protein
MTTSSSSTLCRYLDPRTLHPTVYQKIVRPGVNISLRPVQLATDDDLQTISEWLHHGYAINLPVDQLRVMYILIAESSYTQAFMIWLNHNTPIAQLDIYQVSQDELKGHYEAREGDFRLHTFVIPAPELYDDLPVHVIQMSLEYFFDHSEVERIVWSVNIRDTRCNDVAQKANFTLLGTYIENTGEGDQEMNLYALEAQP